MDATIFFRDRGFSLFFANDFSTLGSIATLAITTFLTRIGVLTADLRIFTVFCVIFFIGLLTTVFVFNIGFAFVFTIPFAVFRVPSLADGAIAIAFFEIPDLVLTTFSPAMLILE
ncbi:MAG: hypothetical protein ITD45_03900 [Nitrosospira sp.]|nr:hypothetical protein [Nitrosospira sp.]